MMATNHCDVEQREDKMNENENFEKIMSNKEQYLGSFDYSPGNGAYLSGPQKFTNKKTGHTFCAAPLIVDFRRLMQLKSSTNEENMVVDGVSCSDLLHAVIGLYDVSLSEMTPDVLYSTVCERWAKTVVLIKSKQDTLEDLKERAKIKLKSAKNPKDCNEKERPQAESTVEDKNNSTHEDEDKFDAGDEEPSKFAEVFSDTDSEEEEEEEDDEDEDFSKGINTFINSSVERRKARLEHEGTLQPEHIGVENMIVGAMTYEKKYIKHKDKIIHLTLITTRKRYRKYGVGKYLMSLVADPEIVGPYEAIVVHADNSAIEFFSKFDFSDDLVLNSRWSELAEQFTNCTLMSYLPGFTGQTFVPNVDLSGLKLPNLDEEFKKWKDKTLEAHQAQVCCVMKMKHEITQLKYMLSRQEELLEMLITENAKLKACKAQTEKEFLLYRLASARDSFGDCLDSPEPDLNTSDLIDKLQDQIDRMDTAFSGKMKVSKADSPTHEIKSVGDCQYIKYFPPVSKHAQEPYDHTKDSAFFYEIVEQFQNGLQMDKASKTKYEIKTVTKATVSPESFYRTAIEMKDPSNMQNLYFCDTLNQPERIQVILGAGFATEDFTAGEYGKGLYFSKYPSKAAILSNSGKIMLAKVVLGKTEVVSQVDKTRERQGENFDSICVPCRQKSTTEEGPPAEEYLIFNCNQALPLCVISFVSI